MFNSIPSSRRMASMATPASAVRAWADKALCAGLILVTAAVAQAQPAGPAAPASSAARSTCTQLPPGEWLDAAEFKLLAAHRGYRIVVFKVTYGACYEIYGYDRDGSLVEAYFNPVNARLIRSNRVPLGR